MTDFVSLTCPTCGGKLEITPDIERFACGHCGNEHVVKRAGGLVSLAPIEAKLEKIQAGTDKTAQELEHQRIRAEILVINQKLAKVFDLSYKGHTSFVKTGVRARLAREKKISALEYFSITESEVLDRLVECSWDEVKPLFPEKPFTLDLKLMAAIQRYRELALQKDELASRLQDLVNGLT